jgi:diaminopimelate epimerase
MTGSGNDFVFVDGREFPVAQWSAERIRGVCARRTGVGADGLVVLEPGSRESAVAFHYFNADGTRAAMCGNASLCAARIAVLLELAADDGLTLETDSGPIPVRSLPGDGEWAKISLPDVKPAKEMAQIDFVPGEHHIFLAHVGVPHVVVVVDDVDAPSADPATRGRVLRHHSSLGPEGANVNFVMADSDQCRVRTYERGVEGETMACGTGVVATALVLAWTDLRELPCEIRTRAGCVLAVSGSLTPDGGLKDPKLTGQGKLVFTAVLKPEERRAKESY